MHLVDIIGYVGCLCLTMLSLPQVYLSYTTKSTQGLSLLYLILGIITGCVYIVYGILLGAIPMIISNILPICSNLMLIYLKYRYDDLDRKQDTTYDELI